MCLWCSWGSLSSNLLSYVYLMFWEHILLFSEIHWIKITIFNGVQFFFLAANNHKIESYSVLHISLYEVMKRHVLYFNLPWFLTGPLCGINSRIIPFWNIWGGWASSNMTNYALFSLRFCHVFQFVSLTRKNIFIMNKDKLFVSLKKKKAVPC